MLSTADLASGTEHMVKKYFPTFQAVFVERNVCCVRRMPQITGLIIWAFKDLSRMF